MLMKTTAAAALLGAALMTTTAFAQSTAPSDTSKTPSVSENHEGLWRASKLVGVNVYNDNNEKLGDINDLLVDKSGNIKNVVIGVGGFLGVGERYISVSFNQLKFSEEPMRTASSSSNTGTSSTSRPAGSTTGSSSSTTSSGKNWYPDHAILNMTKDQVKSAPQFKY